MNATAIVKTRTSPTIIFGTLTRRRKPIFEQTCGQKYQANYHCVPGDVLHFLKRCSGGAGIACRPKEVRISSRRIARNVSEEIPRNLTSDANNEQEQTNVEQRSCPRSVNLLLFWHRINRTSPIPKELGTAPPADLPSPSEGFGSTE